MIEGSILLWCNPHLSKNLGLHEYRDLSGIGKNEVLGVHTIWTASIPISISR